ncbi:MAG TPA: histidine phosphatase family protein [Anaerolineae bacterium]|nr:histidine phosphatase family protein [Anaerolineae bacterium]
MPDLLEAAPSEVTRLILVRHGRTAHNVQGRIQGHTDVPLDAEGREEARRAGEWLREHYAVQALYSSPLSRAHETAVIIGERLGLEPRVSDALIEFDFGLVSDRDTGELAQLDPDLYRQLREWLTVSWDSPMIRPRIPGMEDEKAFRARLVAFWEAIQCAHPGQTVAAVTHGGVIKGMFTLIAGGDLRRHLPFWADNASISVIDFSQGGGTICLFNERSHLGQPLKPRKYIIL